jgi:predicted HicB family RNase H-like nuclease
VLPSKTGTRGIEQIKRNAGEKIMKTLKEIANKYSYNIEFDSDDDIYIARCAELSTLTAHGETQEEALKEIKVAVLGALEWMKKEGEEIPEPFSLHKFSGEFRVRMPPEKHRKIAIEASLQGVSMNHFIVSKL